MIVMLLMTTMMMMMMTIYQVRLVMVLRAGEHQTAEAKLPHTSHGPDYHHHHNHNNHCHRHHQTNLIDIIVKLSSLYHRYLIVSL